MGVLLGTRGLAFALRRDRRWLKRGMAAAMVLWIGAVIFATVLSRGQSDLQMPSVSPLHSYREVLAGGTRELLRANFMNVLLFYPGGLLARAILTRRGRWTGLVVTVLLMGCFSFLLEFCQYRFCLGMPDIDDVIHNTLGALLGWLAFHGFLRAADDR